MIKFEINLSFIYIIKDYDVFLVFFSPSFRNLIEKIGINVNKVKKTGVIFNIKI